MPLLRPEALGAQDRLYGDVQLVPPVSWQIVGYFLFASVVTAAIFLSTASHRQYADVAGRIVANKNGAEVPSPSGKGDLDTARDGGSIGRGARLAAEFDIPAETAGRIKPGEVVHIAIDAFPDRTFGTIDGRILALSPTTVATIDGERRRHDVFVASASLTHTAIAAFGRTQPLRPGMTVTARIETGRRSLLGWLADPMRSASQR